MDKTTSLSQKAYTLIRQKIVTLELAPGSIIDETRLEQELMLGRTPIREALLRLSLEKLISIIPRRGIFVSDISIPHLLQLFELRLALEPLAARLAASRANEAHFQRLGVILNYSESSNDLTPSEIFIRVDQACHQIVYEAADNKYLEDTLNILYTLSLRLWYYSRVNIKDLQVALEIHRSIISALKNRDADLVSDLLGQHIRSFQEEIQGAMLGLSSRAS